MTMRPPLPGMPGKERCFDREHFTWQRILCQNPAHEEAGKVPVGEPSLSGEPECLSLHSPILWNERKSGNTHLRMPFFPPHERDGTPERNFVE
jgi:hypothetical protein